MSQTVFDYIENVLQKYAGNQSSDKWIRVQKVRNPFPIFCYCFSLDFLLLISNFCFLWFTSIERLCKKCDAETKSDVFLIIFNIILLYFIIRFSPVNHSQLFQVLVWIWQKQKKMSWHFKDMSKLFYDNFTNMILFLIALMFFIVCFRHGWTFGQRKTVLTIHWLMMFVGQWVSELCFMGLGLNLGML